MTEFEGELRILLNRHSIENESDTPDFILASFIRRQLAVWNTTLAERDLWYGRHESPGLSAVVDGA